MKFESFHILQVCFMCRCILLLHVYIFGGVRDNFLSEFLPFRPYVFLLMHSNNRTSFDTSVYHTDSVILYKININIINSIIFIIIIIIW